MLRALKIELITLTELRCIRPIKTSLLSIKYLSLFCSQNLKICVLFYNKVLDRVRVVCDSV
jgi:hypothetical protein